MERLYRTIVDRPKVILFAIALATAVFGAYAWQIRIDSSIEALLPEDDPAKTYYREIRRLYGSDEIGVIGVVAADVYQPEVLRKIQRLTAAVGRIDGVAKVMSLTNLPDPIADPVELPPLVPKIPTTKLEIEELRAKLADRGPLFLKNFVSPDGRAAAINVFFADLPDDEFMRRGIDEAVEAVAAAERGAEEIHYTGLPHFKVYSAKAMWRDLETFVPLTLAIIVAVLFACFRSVRGVALPALTVVVSLTWTLGLMVLAGSRLSLGTTSLPPLVLVIGTAYSLHVIAEYYELAREGRPVREVVLETLRRVSIPASIAAVTTVLGFLSIAVNDITSIRQMGIYSAFGIAIAFVLSILLVPACLALLRLPASRAAGDFSPGLAAALRRVGQASIRHRRAVIAVAAVAAAAMAGPIPYIHVDSNFQSFFRENDPIRVASDAINRHLAGSSAFYVAIDGKKNVVKNWDTLKRIRDLQRHLESLPGVEKAVSFVDYVELFDRGAQAVAAGEILIGPNGELIENPEPGEKKTFWENPAQLAAALQLISMNPKAFSTVVTPDFARTNVLVRTSLTRSSDVTALADEIRSYASKHFPPELRVQPTGNLILLTQTTGNIVVGQIQSLALTAGTIFVIMAAMFLSLRVGLIAMIPNVFPIVFFLGLMGATGADLNLATNMIASIALGIAVDDTIHIMSRLSAEVRATGDQERALLETISTVGKPALYASVLLFFGFLALCASSFVPIQEFGFLSAATLVFAFVGEVALTPALLSTTRIITLWDVLYLKLGKDPHRTIGIFENLRPWQAKIVALMGELRSVPRAETIVREGEMGDAMYVIINGAAEVRVDSGGRQRVVRRLGRGDVFGEMGLIRHDRRTADVVAVEDVELMSMDERFLARIERRYPRIAVKILKNISKILSDRLQKETERLTA